MALGVPRVAIIQLIFLLCALSSAIAYERHAPASGVSVDVSTHPRLYLADDRLSTLKKMLHTHPYDVYWGQVRKLADQYTAEALPPSTKRWNDNDIRMLGDKLPYLALAYLLTDQNRYLDAILRWAKYIIALPSWGSDVDIGAAHLIFGLSVTYDWLYASLPAEDRRAIQEAIRAHVEIMFDELVRGRIWWTQSQSLLQNHNYTNVMSIGIAAVALEGEVPSAEVWKREAAKNFAAVFSVLSPDGASPEGVAYWSYGLESLLKYLLGVRSEQNLALLKAPYLENAAKYRLYMSAPGYGAVVNYSDSPLYDYKGPGHMLRALSSVFRNPHAQWLANELQQAYDKPVSWMDLLWYDGSVPAIPPADLPTYAYFDNSGMLVSRTNWQPDAKLVFYKGGGPQGKVAYDRGIYAGSHLHPDVGELLLWDGGEWLLSDDGYVFKKSTANHNTVLFNGLGQLGEGQRWFNPNAPRKYHAKVEMRHVKIEPHYQAVSSELAGLYPEAANLSSWVRSVHMLEGEAIVVEDRFLTKMMTQVDRLIHAQKPIKSITKDQYCIGNYLLQLFDAQESVTEVSKYTIPKNERNKDLGYYDGWLLDTKIAVHDRARSVFVLVPAGDACRNAAGLTVRLDGDLVTISTPERIWYLNLPQYKFSRTTP